MKWLVRSPVHGDQPWAVQIEAIRRSDGAPKYAYLLDMGLGKTALTFNDYLNFDDVDLCLVIVPNSFKLDWAMVPAAWGRPDIPGKYWPKHPLPWDDEVGLYAINYEAVRGELRHDLYKLMARRSCMLVIDEATAIKNPGSSTAKVVLELAKRATRVRLLNGTPLAQNVEDYYQQLRCVGKLNGWMPIAFRNRFAEMGGYMGQQVVGVRNEEELAEILDSCSFRAVKSEWRKDLPPRVYIDPIHVEMTKKQEQHYREMMSEFYTQVAGLDVTAEMVLTQYDRLRQISGCLAISGSDVRLIEQPENNPKLRAVLDVHASGQGKGKTIVVYTYRASGEMLFGSFSKRGLHPAWLRGQMKPEILVEEKRKFNEDPACRVMIAQEDAACRGHTLIGGEGDDSCCRMAFYEQNFSYWMRAQMEDRNYRGSQKETCHVYDIVTSPMDQFVIDTVRGKKELAQRMDEMVEAIGGKKL